MGKKAKGGGGGGGASKESLGGEAEAKLRLQVADLEERLHKSLGASESSVAGHKALSEKLVLHEKEKKDIVDYLNLELDKANGEFKDLQERYGNLVLEKDGLEKKLSSDAGALHLKLSTCEAKLAESQSEVEVLKAQVVEIGTLRSNRDSDVSAKSSLSAELADAQLQLSEQDRHLRVLAMAGDRIVGDDGARAVPLLLLEALRLHASKPILCEQAMTGLQYVLSTERHSDSELLRYRGGVELVLDAMRRHEEEAELLSAACGLLWKLAFADPPVRPLVLNKGGMPLIMAAMQKHTSHPRLNYNACGALRHLLVSAPRDFSKESQIAPMARTEPILPPLASDPRGRGRAAAPGGHKRSPNRGLPHDPRTLPVKMPASSSHPRLRDSAAMPHVRSNPALATAASGGERRGAGGLLTPATRPAMAHASLLSSAGRRSVEEGESRLVAKEDVSVQAVRLTLASMDAHPETPLVQEYGCGTLFNVCAAHAAHKVALVDAGGISTVLRAMEGHTAATGVQVNACALLKELAEYQPALPQIEAGNGRALLLAAMANHQYNEDLIDRATQALRYLPEELAIPDEDD